MHKVVFKIALNMVEEFDGKKGDEKYDEDFLQQYIGKFLDQKSAWGTSDEIFNHCIKNFFKKLNPDDTRTRSTRKRRVPGGPVMTYSTTASSLNIIRTSSRSPGDSDYEFYSFDEDIIYLWTWTVVKISN